MAEIESAFEHEYRRLQDLAESFVHDLELGLPEMRIAFDGSKKNPDAKDSPVQNAASVYQKLAHKLRDVNQQFKLTEEKLRTFGR